MLQSGVMYRIADTMIILVRKVEELVNTIKPEVTTRKKDNAYTLEQEILSKALQAPVKITGNKLTISFHNEEQLKGIINRLV